jgi:hypothetical protein
MEDLLEIAKKIGASISILTAGIRNYETRVELTKKVIKDYRKNGILTDNVKVDFVGEKPMKGANGSVKKMKNSIRIQYRCGYSSHNYAPCIELKQI